MPHNIEMGYFISVFIDRKNNMLMYYNPLGFDPVKNFVKNIKPYLIKIGMKHPQFKINKIRNQALNSSNCGYFAMKWLMKMYKGESFKEASGYNHFMLIQKSEKDIRRFKNKIKEFQNI